MERSILFPFSFSLLPFLLVGCGPEPVTLTAKNTRVVIAPDACPVVKFAATEMTNFLGRVLGGPVPIWTEVEKRGGGGERWVNIVLGTNAWSTAAGLHPEKLPRDSFILSSTSTSNFDLPSTAIYISGCDDPSVDVWQNLRQRNREMCDKYERGTVFGVYDFLERFAGCRFYFPGELGEIVPRKERLVIPCGRIVEVPSFARRQWYAGGVVWPEDASFPKFANSTRYYQGLNLLRQRRSSIWYPGHAMTFMQLQERFGKTHPEYFQATRQKDGTLTRATNRPFRLVAPCFSSAVTNEIYEDVKAFYTGKSAESRGYKPTEKGTGFDYESVNGWSACLTDGRTFSVGPDDGSGPDCQCGVCEKRYRRELAVDAIGSDFIWSWTAAIGERLVREGVKGYLQQYAYSFYRQIPEGVKMPTNVIAVVCCNGPWSRFKPEEREKDLKMVRDWAAFTGNRVYLHNWALKYSRLNIPDVPAMWPVATGQYYADVAPWAQGVMFESSSDHFMHAYLANYIAAKVTWNPKFDWRGALREHYELMFGPAADEMERFFTDLEDLWLGKMAAGKTEMNAFGPVQVVPSPFEMWRTIYTAEKLAEWRRLFDVAEKKLESQLGVRERTEKFHSPTRTLNSNYDLYQRRIELMKRSILDTTAAARKKFVEATSMELEEARRKREGVRNVLDKAYSADYSLDTREGDWETQSAKTYLRVPFKYDKAKKYRLSYYINLENVVPQYAHKFCGALVAIYGGSPYGSWGYSLGASAQTGNTAGWVHISRVYDFSSKECKPDGLVIWLRGSTGKMQVKDLILEEVK